MIAAFALLATLLAQHPGVVVTGTVVKVVAGDTVPVVGARVVIHRVTTAKQGPVDSLLSRANGEFRFGLPRDSGAIYLISARWEGVEYFAPPVVFSSLTVTEPVMLAVADTASDAPVSLLARHLVVSAPAPDGTRDVVELLVVQNRGEFTRVARDSLTPTWQFVLPPEALRPTISESDFAADAVDWRGDTLRLHSPLPPGQRQVTLEYQLPAGLREWRIAVADSIPTMNLLIEEISAGVDGPLMPADSQVSQGKRFSRWKGGAPRGAVLAVSFAATGTPPWLLTTLVVLLGVALALGLGLAWRRPSARLPRTAAPSERHGLPPGAEALLDTIAALDAAHVGGVGVHDPLVWQRYMTERAALKQELEAHLPP